MESRNKHWLANSSLLLVTAIWGITFVTVKNAIELMPPYSFNFIRFSLATVVMLSIGLFSPSKCKPETIKTGLLVGILLFAGYSFQTIGLMYTSASNAGFITGLSVIMVPLIMTITTKKLPEWGVTLGASCALLGLGLLSINDSWSFNFGDGLILMCALFFALHVISVGKHAKEHQTIWLVTWQLAAVAIMSGVFAFFTEPAIKHITAPVWQALFITAIFATCLAFFLQTYMQRFTSPSHTAIIFATEPVFAALFAVLLLQEILGPRAIWGGILVFCGIIMSEFKTIASSFKYTN